MPATTSFSSRVSSGRDDDLADFLLSHHVKEEREARCFAFRGRHACSRCLGWMSGALAAAFLVASGVFVYSWWAYFLPVPAFVDWVGRKLDFFSGGKLSTFGTGIVMGTSVPYFLYGAITLNPAAFAFAAGYLAFYALILLAGKRGRASTDQKPRKGDSRIA